MKPLPKADLLSAVDGRVRRGVRSREAIVAALMDLVGNGVLQPTVQQVADRAGVSVPTIVRIFGTKEGMLTAVAAREAPERERLRAVEPGDYPASTEVGFLNRKRAAERRNVLAGPEHSLPRHQQVPAAARLRIVELGVSEQGEHPAHASLNPPTAPVSRAAASARWPAEVEISSVDALSCCAAAKRWFGAI